MVFDRRLFLSQAAAASCFSGLCPSVVSAAKAACLPSNPKLLFFSKSSGYQHAVIDRKGKEFAFAERIMLEWAESLGIEVTCSKDGRIFEKDYESFDAFFFYTSGNLCELGTDREPAMSQRGKNNLIDAVAGGTGFLGVHSASDTFHSSGTFPSGASEIDPYIQMLGGEFIRHGRQQRAYLRVADAEFSGISSEERVRIFEEWYSLKHFASDMHVVLVQETEGMVDDDYKRPAYPATWIREHGDGRVFYTSMGHREDIWVNPTYERLIAQALRWCLKMVDADTTPNLEAVTPGASTLPSLEPN